MAAVFVVAATPAGGVNGGTTSAVNTTGATQITLVTTRFTGGGAVTISDSKSNTWTARTEYDASGDPGVRFYDCFNPTVGTGHTFTIAGTGVYASVGALAFSGMASGSFDQVSGANATGVTTIQPGSITPAANDAVVISGMGWNPSSSQTPTINGSFSSPTYIDPGFGTTYGTAISYWIQTTATASNPTWACATMTPTVAIQASYLSAGSASTRGRPFGHRGTTFNGGRALSGLLH